ncbi:hypothetical protein [Nonomuraea sp. B19D2]
MGDKSSAWLGISRGPTDVCPVVVVVAGVPDDVGAGGGAGRR